MAITEIVGSADNANWRAPKQMSDEERTAHLDRIHAANDERIISISTDTVRDALAILTSPAETITAEELNLLPSMSEQHAIATLQATAYVQEPIRTMLLEDDRYIGSFIPGNPEPILNAK